MNKIAKIYVTLFGIGFVPISPGTLGSIISIIFFYIIYDYLTIYATLFIFIITFIISIKFISIYMDYIKKEDPSEIVIDEFLGVNFILIFYDYFQFASKSIMFIIIFLLFRFFDIFKFYPANLIDKKLKNSLGVILDDIVAGVYSIIILYILNVFL